MTPTQFRAFHAVATTGSFTAAARMLHTSQPPITTHVRELEEHYGVELFHRHGRGAELTAVGAELLAIANRIVAGQEEAVEFLRNVGGLRTGRLRVGMVAPHHLIEVIAAFHARYPGITIVVSQGNSAELLDGLRHYRSDLALVGRFDGLTEMHAIHHSSPEIVMLVHRDHPWATRGAVRLAELADQPLIFREAGSNTQRALQEAAERAGVALRPALTFASREGLVAAVMRGLGVGPLPIDQFVAYESLRTVRIQDVRVSVDAFLVCLQERRESRVIRAFMELAIEKQQAARP
jgi:aminoethylphosphonate catabolism LysR family transcriptional regulator